MDGVREKVKEDVKDAFRVTHEKIKPEDCYTELIGNTIHKTTNIMFR